MARVRANNTSGGGGAKYSYSGMYRRNYSSGNLEVDYTTGTYSTSTSAGDKCNGAVNFGSDGNTLTIKKDGVYDIMIYSNGSVVHQGLKESVSANTTYSFTVGTSASTQLDFVIIVY